MKRIIQVLLALSAIGLAYLLVDSIMKPIRFDNLKNLRYEVCIQRLKEIRTAQEAYKSVYQKYTASFDTLINFAKCDSFRVVRQIGSLDDSVAVAEGRVYRDTVAVCVRDSLYKSGFPIDSLRYVPFTDGKQFHMEAGELLTGSKVVVQVFMCQVPNKVLLKGLDHQAIINLNDVAHQLDRYPGLQVGSMTEATNNAGNWE